MRYNSKILAVTAVLAVGMMMTACGSKTASSAGTSSAVSSMPASSTAVSSEAAQTGDILPIAQGTLEEMKTGSYKFAANITSIKDGQAVLDVYSYDAYNKEDIDGLQVGDVIQVHDQGDQTVTKMTVESLENDADTGYVSINGGIEEGGLDLVLDHDVYRTFQMDDYPLYYEVGEMTLPLADDVTLEDSSADPQADAVESDGAAAVEEAFNTDPDYWICNNTTIFTDNGKVSNIVRVWVP